MSLNFQQYRLEFEFPVNFFGQFLSHKYGLIVSYSHNGNIYYSDIPLFTELSPNLISNYCSVIALFFNSINSFDDTQPVFIESSKLVIPKNFLFGLNSLILKIYLAQFGSSSELNVNSYTFIQDISHITSSLLSDLDSVKVKFSGTKEECNCLNTLYNSSGSKFRLDFNRKFDLNHCLSILDLLNSNAIKYIEEPCSTTDDLLILPTLSNIPIALDETLINRELTDELAEIASYFIVKPSMIGDYNYIDKLIKTAKSNNISIVFSSAYESYIGINAIKDLVRYYNLQDELMGLDTEKLIKSFNYLESNLC